jgi:hypothetical protein
MAMVTSTSLISDSSQFGSSNHFRDKRHKKWVDFSCFVLKLAKCAQPQLGKKVRRKLSFDSGKVTWFWRGVAAFGQKKAAPVSLVRRAPAETGRYRRMN